MATNVLFNSNSFQTNNILTADIDHHGWPDVSVKQYPLSHGNKSAIPYTDWPKRTITISGLVYGSSITDLDSRLDTFKYNLLGTDKNLDIDYNGSTRRYTATVTKVGITRPGGLTFAKYSVDFTCNVPFGMDTSNTTALSASGRTSASYNDSYTFLGTAPYQLLVTTITLTAVSSSGSQYMWFGNGGNGQVIQITRSTWAASDVVVIDCTQRTVTVNGAAVAFVGAFPEFPVGAGTLQYVDSFTSRTFTISSVYQVRYL